jgi:hypothetical protein
VFFFFAYMIIATACTVITCKTLVGYSARSGLVKTSVSVLIALGWYAPIIMTGLSWHNWLDTAVYAPLFNIIYNLMGFVFILFMLLMLRDALWYLVYGVVRFINKGYAWSVNPRNLSLLDRANVVTLALSILISGWALYQGCKTPEVRELPLYSDKINHNFKLVQASDLHLTRATPLSRVNQLVNRINMLNPDVIVLTGDVIDDSVPMLNERLAALKELSAPYGVYVVMGNHEFYNDIYAAKHAFDALGFNFLFNGGEQIADSNVYIAGIPDLNTMFERISLYRTFNKSQKSQYKILLSHTPNIVSSLSTELTDLVLSGHTHGGQIFPVHFLVKQANEFLSGSYRVNGIDLFVSKGAGTWGPSMRLFAPSDIVLINLIKK